MRACTVFTQTLDLVGLVLLVVAVEEHPLAVAFGRQNVRTDAIEEPAVMADDHDAASKFEQRIFQGTQGFHVQVITGFVQQQHVAALHQRLGQVQATAFAAREQTDLFLLITTVEVESAAVGAAGHLELAHSEDIQPPRDVFPDGLVVAQVVTALVHKGHSHGLADGDFATIGGLLARNELEQRRFTRAVGADDAHNRARRHLEAQVINQQAVAKRFAHALELDHFLPQPFGHRDEDFLRLVALLVFVITQFFKAGQTRLALGLAALGILARPLQLLLHGLHAGVFGFLFLLQASFLLLQPRAVVSLPWNAVAAVKFQNPLGSVVQEVAVVRDADHSAREALQELLQPLHRFGIQVVGGLIQQQHVGLGQQQAAQRHTALFAAR